MRKPSTPRSSQKRITAYSAACTSGLRIRLFLQERVVVVLPGCFIPCPRRTAEVAHPVVGRPAAGLRISPDIPVTFVTRARTATFHEPRVVVGGVIGHEVENDLNLLPMRLAEQARKALNVSEDRVDAAVVGDVIAKIGHGRGIDG